MTKESEEVNCILFSLYLYHLIEKKKSNPCPLKISVLFFSLKIFNAVISAEVSYF